MLWPYNPLMIPLAVTGCVCLALLIAGGRHPAEETIVAIERSAAGQA